MFGRFEWMLAFRYLRARRAEGFISVIAWFSLLGIMLGVATLIIVMSVMNGFRAELMERILGINGHLNISPSAGAFDDYDAVADIIKGVAHVTAVSPLIERQVLLSVKGQARGAVVRGMRPRDLAARPLIANSLSAQSMDAFAEKNAVLVGRALAAKMGITQGDSLNIIAPQGYVTAFGTTPRISTKRVVGIFDAGMYEYDNGFVFMPHDAAQVFFRMKGKTSLLEVFADSPDQAEPIARTLRENMGGGWYIRDWQRINAGFFNAIEIERNVMFLILTLIIMVATFNIISSLIMLVQNKGRDIAILRTMGAGRTAIMRVFFICGTGIGTIGTILGFALGLWFSTNIETIRQWLQSISGTDLFAAEIYFLSQLPAQVNPWDVLTVVGLSLGLSVLATLYPSWRAAGLDPAEALRYE